MEIANLSTTDVRREIAVATAQAYSRSSRRSVRSRASAHARRHWHTSTMPAGVSKRAPARGSTSCAQDGSASSEARLEVTQLAVHIAQEALGVLIAAAGPVDASAEPTFDIPTSIDAEAGWMALRPDIRLFEATERAADREGLERLVSTGIASFDPQALVPASIFSSGRSWRFVVSFSQPVFDAGFRRGQKRLRESALNVSRLALTGLQIQARSEAIGEERSAAPSGRAQLRSAAEQANEVLKITTFAFEAGATNLEVIDAQRQARDEDSAAAVAQDVVQRARLDLLTALGRFPQ